MWKKHRRLSLLKTDFGKHYVKEKQNKNIDVNFKKEEKI